MSGGVDDKNKAVRDVLITHVGDAAFGVPLPQKFLRIVFQF